MDLLKKYKEVRKFTEDICAPLEIEDYVVQPIVDVSPPKWHIGHTTWFFETFILKQYMPGYVLFDPAFPFVFNSYYETEGARVIRTDRGNLSRPTVENIYKYRKYVDQHMSSFLASTPSAEIAELIILGLNHEQQHQELLMTDIKYILGNNPLFPAYKENTGKAGNKEVDKNDWIKIVGGVYEVGFTGKGFCFDNELNRHKIYLEDFEIASNLITNGEFLEFIKAGGYKNFTYWHAEGWDWVNTNKLKSPMYWHLIDNNWYAYTLNGLVKLDLNETLNHISFYEASAFASWRGKRLPTEFEWEIAAPNFKWGERWEWTESAYLPYPGFSKAPGAIGEYNGKFMVNQKVLRGASEVTSPDHSRISYRNFFPPQLRWQYTGIRLAK